MNKILEYIKTDHFLYRQWNRSIEDGLLYKILPSVECIQCEKDVIIILPSFLQRKGVLRDEKDCLILIVKQKFILTGYWCNRPNSLFNKEKNVHFQVLY